MYHAWGDLVLVADLFFVIYWAFTFSKQTFGRRLFY
jgi:hypothetical protein